MSQNQIKKYSAESGDKIIDSKINNFSKEPRLSSQVNVEQPHSALWKKKGWTDKRGNQTRDFH